MKWISHRGDLGRARENTWKAFKLALEYPIWMIETDIRLSKDDQWMIYHDASLSRLDKTDVLVRELPAAELVSEYGIPTLSSTLDYIASITTKRTDNHRPINLYLDIKEAYPGSSLDNLVQLLESHIEKGTWSAQQFYLASYNTKIVRYLLYYHSKWFRVGKITSSDLTAYDWANCFPDLDFIAIGYEYLLQEDLTKLRVTYPQLSIFGFVMNDPATIDKYIHYSLDGILSDYPSLFKRCQYNI